MRLSVSMRQWAEGGMLSGKRNLKFGFKPFNIDDVKDCIRIGI
jgi:hypothetical protein